MAYELTEFDITWDDDFDSLAGGSEVSTTDHHEPYFDDDYSEVVWAKQGDDVTLSFIVGCHRARTVRVQVKRKGQFSPSYLLHKRKKGKSGYRKYIVSVNIDSAVEHFDAGTWYLRVYNAYQHEDGAVISSRRRIRFS